MLVGHAYTSRLIDHYTDLGSFPLLQVIITTTQQCFLSSIWAPDFVSNSITEPLNRTATAKLRERSYIKPHSNDVKQVKYMRIKPLRIDLL